MKSVKLVALAALTLGLSAVLAAAALAYRDDPQLTIKEVMKKAHGDDGLLKKVLSGDASKDDKETLLKLYTALSLGKPPRGEEAAWKDQNKPILEAAKGVVADQEGAAAKLKEATNCKACHLQFKKPK
jgi:hypothetical protein